MRGLDHHDALTCSDLKLDQERINDELGAAASQLTGILLHYFGSVQVRLALDQGLEHSLRSALHAASQGVADVISSAYVSEALSRAHEATANMFEGLAAGALIAHKVGHGGKDVGEVAHALAMVAACEGRPEILNLETAGKATGRK